MKIAVAFFSCVILVMAQPKPPGKLVSIGSRKIHIHCVGQSHGPVVVFVNGVPRFSFHFALVQPQVAVFTRACVYDRAGEAWSDPMPGPPSAEATLEELNAVIAKVGDSRPVILVGHSFGGVIARAYQRKYPQRVAGLVLIDSPHPDAATVSVNGKQKRMADLTAEDCQAVAAAHKDRPPAPDPKIEPPFDKLPAALQPAHLWAMKKWQDESRRIDTAAALQYLADFYRAIKDTTYTDLPIVVITRAKSDKDEDVWIDQQRRIAATSIRGVLIKAIGSGHDIELEQPDTVASQGVGAILAMIPRR